MANIKLKPGDYVSAYDLSEGEYDAVAEAFMEAGAEQGEYRDITKMREQPRFGWGTAGGLLHYHTNGSPHPAYGSLHRQLTVDQVLGATNAQWRGEGRPPVGTHCHARHLEDSGPLYEVDIVLYHEGYVWVRRYHFVQANVVWLASEVEFIPLRSEEEEDEAVDQMADAIRPWCPSNEMLRCLYRAGWRKVEDNA